MKKLISVLCLVCMALSPLSATALSAADDLAEITVAGETDVRSCKELLVLMNAVRAENGLMPLTMDAKLTKAAAVRAAEQSVSYGHTRPDGTSWTTALPKAYAGRKSAENLLWSSTYEISASEMLEAWMESAGHRKNILTPECASVGIGAFISGENLYLATLFCSEKNVTPPTDADYGTKAPITADAGKLRPVLTVTNADKIKTGDKIATTLSVYNDALAQFGVITVLSTDCYTVRSENGCAVITEDGGLTAVSAGADILTAEIVCESGRKITASAEITVTGESIVPPETDPPEIITPEPLPFTDVPEDAWYAEAVRFAYENGIMVGVGYNLFVPEGVLTREMFTRLLYNLEGNPALTGESVFTDVNPNAWYADSVTWAAEVGLVSGYGDGTFGVGDPLTREQMACLIAHYARYKGHVLTERGNIESFADYGNVSKDAREELSLLVGAGIVSGVGGNRIDPQGTATRAQAAAIIRRVLTELA